MNVADKARLAREKELKDSENNKIKEQIRQIAKSERWSIVTFGNYFKNVGKDPLEWILLDAAGDEITLVSKDIIDCYPFTNSDNYQHNISVNWSSSLIRKWLNNDFLNKAFNENEQNFICTKEIDSSYYNDNITDRVSATTNDKVYLLSKTDFKKGKTLFGNRLAKCKPTNYALSKSIIGKKIRPLWWFRDMDQEHISKRGYGYYAHIVFTCGKYKYVSLDSSEYRSYLTSTEQKCVGVRPVITLRIDD